MTPERWKQIEQLYHAALKLEPGQRAAFFQEACAGDGDLRREVESLLAQQPQAESFVEASALEATAQAKAETQARSMVGRQLGAYKILSLLGAGGMGEVYRAKDTRLDRTVAIKVLPYEVSDKPEMRQRFEREARVISSLSHPHICALYDIGRQDSVDFLVMEYLEGQTLAERLAKGALPLDQALRFAVEIADALDQAHRHGVVHRDLKPGNIMLTKSGIKLLDFGLAKHMGGRRAPSRVTERARSARSTQNENLTEEGMILGTLHYMAPEQLEGKEADARADVFAFGAVVFEMVTGRKAFQGENTASVIAAILSSEPAPISTLQPISPPLLDRVVKRCLAKDPEDRWQSARDLMLELKWVAEGGSRTGLAAPSGPQRLRREHIAWGMALLILLGSLSAFFFVPKYFRSEKIDKEVIRFQISLPDKTTPGSNPYSAPQISPDGRRLAFAASSDGKVQLWVRSLDSIAARALPDTDGAYFPFWSPDSRYIGFFTLTPGKLKKVDPDGKNLHTICEVPFAVGGSWNRDGIILFNLGFRTIYQVSDQGGTAKPLTTLDSSRGEVAHLWPHFLPDGRHFFFYAFGSQIQNRGIYVGSLDSPDRRFLLNVNSSGTFAPPGLLLYWRDGSLWAHSFDTTRLELSGEPYPLAEGVELVGHLLSPLFSVSDNGGLAYYSSGGIQTTELVWLDRTGKKLGSAAGPAECWTFDLSHDERQAVLECLDPKNRQADLWLINLVRGNPSRFTSDPMAECCPVWSSDGGYIIFAANGQGVGELYKKPVGGMGEEELLLKSDGFNFPRDMSQDGRFLIYQQSYLNSAYTELWVLPLFGDRKPFPFLQRKFNDSEGEFSPNGQWIAYASNESGNLEVYVQPFPKSGAKWMVSTKGGRLPKWRKDGKELFYLSEDSKLMAVNIRYEPAFEASPPKALFPCVVPKPPYFANPFSVAANGQRFLVLTPIGEQKPVPINVVLNWTAGLKIR